MESAAANSANSDVEAVLAWLANFTATRTTFDAYRRIAYGEQCCQFKARPRQSRSCFSQYNKSACMRLMTPDTLKLKKNTK